MILKGGDRMRKGKLIIEYESDELGKCSFNINQQGKDKLDDNDLIALLEHIIREKMPENFGFQ
jgi:hypothetical protein